MDREAWWATVHGATKELDTTEPLSTHSLRFKAKSPGPGKPLGPNWAGQLVTLLAQKPHHLPALPPITAHPPAPYTTSHIPVFVQHLVFSAVVFFYHFSLYPYFPGPTSHGSLAKQEINRV